MAGQACMGRCSLALWAIFLFFPFCSEAQTTLASTAYDRAVGAYQAHNYPEALNDIQRAVLEQPGRLDYQYLLGGVYFRMGKLDEAEAIFRTLIREDERGWRKAYFDLANIYVKQGKWADALEAIEKARPVDPPRADFESGLVYMQMKQHAKAIEHFRKVRSTGSKLEPKAANQEALALYELKRYDEAKKVLRAVLAMKPPSEDAEEARKLLAAIEDATRGGKPWHITGAVGVQYDGNIFQNPLNQVVPTPDETVTDEDDFGFLANVTGSYDFYRKDRWKIGAAYNHYQLTYFQHTENSLLGARPSVYFRYEDSPYAAGVDVMYSHYWVGDESRADVYSFLPAFTFTHGDHWRTDIRGGAEWRFYYDVTPDDRLFNLGIIEMYLLRKGKAHVRAGYLLEYDDMVPEERGDYIANKALAGFQWPVWRDKWFVDIFGLYIWRNYDFDPLMSMTTERRDEEQDLNVLLRGPITSNTQLNFLFQYIWNDSNLTTVQGNQSFDPFKYERAIFTCYVTFDY